MSSAAAVQPSDIGESADAQIGDQQAGYAAQPFPALGQRGMPRIAGGGVLTLLVLVQASWLAVLAYALALLVR